MYHVIFAGGGLSSGLAAYWLSIKQPSLRIAIIEKEHLLGGIHTWCFHASDIDEKDRELVQPFISRSWSSYKVCFPKYERIFSSSYFAVESARFHEVLMQKLGKNILLGEAVQEVGKDFVRLDDGRKLLGRLIIDGRGWPGSHRKKGYQKFLGQRLKLRAPHHLPQPVLMDALCKQEDGYRFFYVLPWAADELLVEDTRYSNSSFIDEPEFRKEIALYCKRQGWEPEKVLYEERGSLPLPLNPLSEQDSKALPCGMAGELFHPTTGYSLPVAVEFAKRLSELSDFKAIEVKEWARHYRKGLTYFYLLNRLMFRASRPQDRFKVLQHFYRLPEPLIQHFYKGTLSRKEKARILVGKPPVPLIPAVRCLWEGAPA